MKTTADEIARWRDVNLISDIIVGGVVSESMVQHFLKVEMPMLRAESLQVLLTHPIGCIRRIGWKHLVENPQNATSWMKALDFNELVHRLTVEEHAEVLYWMMKWQPATNPERQIWHNMCQRCLLELNWWDDRVWNVFSGHIYHLEGTGSPTDAAQPTIMTWPKYLVRITTGTVSRENISEIMAKPARRDGTWWERRAKWQQKEMWDWDSPEWRGGLKRAIMGETHPAVLEVLVQVWPEVDSQRAEIWQAWAERMEAEREKTRFEGRWLQQVMRNETARRKKWIWKALLSAVPQEMGRKLMKIMAEEVIETKDEKSLRELSEWILHSPELTKEMRDFCNRYLERLENNVKVEEVWEYVENRHKREIAWQAKFHLAESEMERLGMVKEYLNQMEHLKWHMAWDLEMAARSFQWVPESPSVRLELWETLEEQVKKIPPNSSGRNYWLKIYWEAFPRLCPEPENWRETFLNTLGITTDEEVLKAMAQWEPENPETRAQVMLAWAEKIARVNSPEAREVCLQTVLRLRDTLPEIMGTEVDEKCWAVLVQTWKETKDDQVWEKLALELERMAAGQWERQQTWWNGLQVTSGGEHGNVQRQRKAGWMTDEFLSRQCEQWCRQHPEHDVTGILWFRRQLAQMFPVMGVNQGRWPMVTLMPGEHGRAEIQEKGKFIENRKFEVTGFRDERVGWLGLAGGTEKYSLPCSSGEEPADGEEPAEPTGTENKPTPVQNRLMTNEGSKNSYLS